MTTARDRDDAKLRAERNALTQHCAEARVLAVERDELLALLSEARETLVSQTQFMTDALREYTPEHAFLRKVDVALHSLGRIAAHLTSPEAEAVRALRDEAALWEERARHLGWRDEHEPARPTP